jgi:hypothetical protein
LNHEGTEGYEGYSLTLCGSTNHFIIAFRISFVTCPKALVKGQLTHIKIFFGLALTLIGFVAQAQYKVKGTVYDSSGIYPVESVTVMSTGGKGTMTDSLGRYQLDVNETDSIWFSFLGRPTPRYPILKISDISRFDISIRLKMDIMKEVRIRSHSYIEDSIQNRRDYAKVFSFHRPNFESMTSIGPTGAGIDLDELIRLFQFKKNKSMERFRERLLEQEREKFVGHRFNKALVRRLTGLDGEELTRFMLKYRPTYEFTLLSSEYDFQYFIKKSGEEYKKPRAF